MTYPDDWQEKTLGELGYIQMCRRIFQNQTKTSGDIPFYKIGTFGGKANAFISRDLYEKYKKMYPYPEKGDILISAAGTIGKTVIFDGKDSYFQDSNIVWLKVDKNLIDNNYLFWFYRFNNWKNLEGSTIKRLYNSIILNTKIFLPPLDEQKKIAETLSNFDECIDDLAALIEKKKNIRDAALDDLMSRKIRLPGFSGDWQTYLFDDYFSLLPTNTYSRNDLTDRGKIGNIHYGDILIKYKNILTDSEEIPRLKYDSKIKPIAVFKNSVSIFAVQNFDELKTNNNGNFCLNFNRNFKIGDISANRYKCYLKISDVVFADTAEDETVGKAVQIGKISIPLVSGLHTVACCPNYETATGFL